MLLPNEMLLDVLRVVDFSTLVAAKFVAARFLGVVNKFSAELACRRSFRVIFFSSHVSYKDITMDARLKSINYEPGIQTSLAAACRNVAGVIGSHAVTELIFIENTWNMPGVCVVFEAAPALKYAEGLELYSPRGSTTGKSCEAFMHNFSGMKSLRLGLDYEVLRHFSWTFLRQEAARELRLIKFTRCWQEDPKLSRYVEKLVRCCVTRPNLLGGEALELNFSESFFSGALGVRIIELLKDSGCELTFRMRTGWGGGNLLLDESDCTVDVDGTTTRYTSESSGIVVEIKGWRVTIQNRAEVPRVKPRTSE